MSTNELSNKIRGTLFVLLAVFTMASTGWTATYYVNGSTGSDGYNGLYESYQGGSNGPWKTIQYAANTAPPGSHLITVAAGTYPERITVSKSGTDANNPLRFFANGNANTQGFILNGNYIQIEGLTATSVTCAWGEGAGVRVFGSGCVVKNCIVQDCLREGIRIERYADRCIVTDNTIRRCGIDGINVTAGSTNALIENNDISDSRSVVSGCTYEEANGIYFHGSGHTFRGNYIHDIVFANQSGYQPHIDAFQTFYDNGDSATNCTFERNHIYLMEEALSGVVTVCGFMLAGASNITIKNNLIESWSGINTGGGGNSNLKIYNNTFRSSLSYKSAYWPVGIDLENVTNAEVYNNITCDFSYAHYKISGGSGISRDYNCIFNSDGSTPKIEGGSAAAHDLWKKDALFVVKFTDLHLQSNSPCMDAGTPVLQVTNDFDGKPRPQGSGFDIGAYELDTTRPAPPANLRIL